MWLDGVSGQIRTAGIPLRRRTLYPAEVHPQIEYFLSLVLRLNSRSKVIKIIARNLIKRKKLFKFLIPKLIPKPLFQKTDTAQSLILWAFQKFERWLFHPLGGDRSIQLSYIHILRFLIWLGELLVNFGFGQVYITCKFSVF